MDLGTGEGEDGLSGRMVYLSAESIGCGTLMLMMQGSRKSSGDQTPTQMRTQRRTLQKG